MYYVLSRDDCKWCDKAIDLLKEKGKPVQVVDFKENPIIIKLMITSNFRTVPQIWSENEHIGGFSQLVQHFEEPED